MDPITHGIAGALLGKAFFSKRQERVAIFAATLGAVFPDVDISCEVFSRDPLSIVKYHRAITHSFVAMPVFAVLLALLTRALLPWVRRRWPRFADWEAPPLWLLSVIYAVGIVSHILLDGMTSFGTRMWYPISTRRVAWDLLFIVDFSFTTITSIGYGDMTTIGPVSDTLVWLEVMCGQFYMAVVVATIVGMKVAEALSSPQNEH